MKIAPKVNLNQGEKLSGTKPPAEALRPKAGKSRKPVYSKDRASLIREQDEKSGRKLGIVGEAKKAGTAQPKKNWTVLCYGTEGRLIEEVLVRNLLQLQQIGSGPKMNLLAQIDRGKEDYTVKQHGGKPGATRYYLTKGTDSERITSKEIKYLGQVNSSQPKVFQDFLEWGMKNYPAKNYLIMVFGHGVGVTGLLSDDSLEAEEQHHLRMSLPEFSGAVKYAERETGVNQDQVILDIGSCLMGTIETAAEVKDSAAWLVDSQAVISGDAIRPIRPDLALDPDYNLDEMGKKIAQTNAIELEGKPKQNTSSLVDLKQIPQLEKAIMKFKKAAKNSPESGETLKKILEVESRPHFEENTPVSFYASDLYTIAQSVIKDRQLQAPELKEAAMELKSSLQRAVVKFSWRQEDSDNKNAHGMGITTSSEERFYKRADYEKLAFEKETGWSEFMTTYAPGVEPHGTPRQADSVVKFGEGKNGKICRMAEKWLKDSIGFNKEIAEAKRRIKNLDYNRELTAKERQDQAWQIVAQTAIMNECCLSIADMSVLKIWEELVSLASFKPEKMGNMIKTGLRVLSGLDKEISSKTLAVSARNILDSKTDLGYGAMLIEVLAKTTNNERVIAALNLDNSDFFPYHPDRFDPKKQLKAVADLGKVKRSEA